MHPSSLRPETAERLIRGRIAPEDAPAGFEQVAALLHAARGPIAPPDPARISATVAAMAEVVATAPVVPSRGASPRRSLRTKLAAGSAAGVLSLFGGLAAAGALPSAAQNGVADAASHVGLDLPRHGGRHGTNHHTGGGDTGATSEEQKSTGTATHPDNHGACVSEAAHSSTTTSGGNHGQAVSDVARSDCGKPEQATTPTTVRGQGHPGHQNQDQPPDTSHKPSSPPGLSKQPASPGQSGSDHGSPSHP